MLGYLQGSRRDAREWRGERIRRQVPPCLCAIENSQGVVRPGDRRQPDAPRLAVITPSGEGPPWDPEELLQPGLRHVARSQKTRV